jgi:hypothetical protein
MLAGLSQSLRSAPSSQRTEPRLIATYRDAVFVKRYPEHGTASPHRPSQISAKVMLAANPKRCERLALHILPMQESDKFVLEPYAEP